MKKKDVELVKGSIGKWLEIKRSITGLDNGARNCSLCVEYITGSCDGCPVKKLTGEDYCVGTPYRQWTIHHEKVHSKYSSRHRVKGCNECSKLASEELGFLVGLLPVKEIWKVL